MTPEERAEGAFRDMQEAQTKIHWHLSRAAAACLQGLMLGHQYEEDMAAVAEWKRRYDLAVLCRHQWLWETTRVVGTAQ